MSVSNVVADMLVEAGLDPIEYDDVTRLLADLADLADAGAPEPSVELAALLAGGAGGTVRAITNGRRSRIVAGATALVLTGVVGTGVAAAANELPPGAQQLMAEFSSRFLPFDFPHPKTDDGGPTATDGVGLSSHKHGELNAPANNVAGGGTDTRSGGDGEQGVGAGDQPISSDHSDSEGDGDGEGQADDSNSGSQSDGSSQSGTGSGDDQGSSSQQDGSVGGGDFSSGDGQGTGSDGGSGGDSGGGSAPDSGDGSTDSGL